MTSLALAAGLRIESTRNASESTPVQYHPEGPSNAQLDAVELHDYGLLNEASHSQTTTTNNAKTAASTRTIPLECENKDTAVDLEASRPSTPTDRETAHIVPSFSYPSMNKWRVLAACLTYLSNGMNDSAPGALLPYMESYYHIGYAIVSLIWISNAIGFILAAFCTDVIREHIGQAKTLMVSETLIVAGYVILVCSPPFPAVVIAYLIVGLGEAINLALNNVFCANLAQSTVILGVAHGSYGVGGILGPIAATALASSGILWSRFFFILIGLRTICFCFAGWSFWSYGKEGTSQSHNSLQRVSSRQAASETGEPNKLRLLGRALKHRTTIIGALFIFAYQGAEVSESGWFISYLINYRQGDPAKVGYVTAGFWAGITVGRFVLTHAAHRVGEKRFVFALGAGVIGFQLISWLVPNVIGDAGKHMASGRTGRPISDRNHSVAVAIVGLLLGPVYPCGQTVFTRLLPANIQMTAIAFISSAGSSGGAGKQTKTLPYREHRWNLTFCFSRAVPDRPTCSDSRNVRAAPHLHWLLYRHARMLGRTAKVDEEDGVNYPVFCGSAG